MIFRSKTSLTLKLLQSFQVSVKSTKCRTTRTITRGVYTLLSHAKDGRIQS